ncbi:MULTISPECIES: hypothetical protein [Pseudomonas]|nr:MULTISPECIES: hypothetical protein [Pseudomonas]MDR6575174.1 hypothetical protein [Pseudomonas extremaustralis]WEX16319.1 hypothetical protein P2T68_03040 [Pseudomonas sp. G11]WLD68014.1 hypothetical protein QU606_05095 [Pseudomonas sp. OVF7]WLI51584.1 hypothetical protein PSH63_01865 [Pseudomonas sp. FP833]
MMEMDFKRPGAQSPGATSLAGGGHVIGRSRLGLLSICFDGGCSYPSMIIMLQGVFKRYGRLVRFGEKLSAQDWLNRVEERGFQVSDQERAAVVTLMWDRR